MANAGKMSGNKSSTQKDTVSIKYVTKARQWCTTTIEKGIQKQEWSSERPVQNKTLAEPETSSL